ncbi:MAG: hypothetical protein WBO73_03860 [Gammaproteobacteria bacterium]|jgi:hypothetical protein
MILIAIITSFSGLQISGQMGMSVRLPGRSALNPVIYDDLTDFSDAWRAGSRIFPDEQLYFIKDQDFPME